MIRLKDIKIKDGLYIVDVYDLGQIVGIIEDENNNYNACVYILGKSGDIKKELLQISVASNSSMNERLKLEIENQIENSINEGFSKYFIDSKTITNKLNIVEDDWYIEEFICDSTKDALYFKKDIYDKVLVGCISNDGYKKGYSNKRYTIAITTNSQYQKTPLYIPNESNKYYEILWSKTLREFDYCPHIEITSKQDFIDTKIGDISFNYITEAVIEEFNNAFISAIQYVKDNEKVYCNKDTAIKREVHFSNHDMFKQDVLMITVKDKVIAIIDDKNIENN